MARNGKDKQLREFLRKLDAANTRRTSGPGLSVNTPRGGKTLYQPAKADTTLKTYRPAKRNVKRLPRI